MRKIFTLALVVAAALSTASMGCGKGKSTTTGGSAGTGGSGGSGATGGGGSGGSGGSGGGTTSMMTGGGGTGGGTTTTTGPADCSMLFMNPTTCQKAITDKCCQEISDCVNDSECNDCLTNPNADPQTCGANAFLGTFLLCQGEKCSGAADCGEACDANVAMPPSMGSCVTVDGTNNECNPVTNDKCDGAAGAACDVKQGGFKCYPDGNTHDICTGCGNGAQDQNFCKGGLTCFGVECVKYCCTDADCGAKGTCKLGDLPDPKVGHCTNKG